MQSASYFIPLARQEAKDGGLTVVVDARKQPPAPVLFSALRSVQVHCSPCACATDVPGGVPAWGQVLLPFGGPSEPAVCPLCHVIPQLAAASPAGPGAAVPGAPVFISLMDFTRKLHGVDLPRHLSAACGCTTMH